MNDDGQTNRIGEWIMKDSRERILFIVRNFNELEMKVEELKELGDLSLILDPSIEPDGLILHRVLITCTGMMRNEKAAVRIAAAKALTKIVERRRIFVRVDHPSE